MSTFNTVLVIGSGPVSSAQPATSAADTDLSCRALVAAGKTVILVTSDPNVFRDERMAARFYVAPLTTEFVSQVLRREKPDAVLASAGGQIALDIVQKVAANGLLAALGVQVLGSPLSAISQTENGEALRNLLADLQIPLPESTYTDNQEQALAIANDIGYPVMMRRGQTRGIARNSVELIRLITDSIGGGKILIERAIRSYKAVELVVMRDAADNCVLLGTLENFDPVGVNPVNTTTITPAQSLTDSDRSALRSACFKVARALDLQGVATVSFAIDRTVRPGTCSNSAWDLPGQPTWLNAPPVTLWLPSTRP
ncbi:ATP-binding protein [Lacticaseibacillus sharpeae]|uniref:ATP-binding protein n=1 Tax=Lacticaseibacillus sharpeae TaxID=1626 RepID=UPI0006D13219|nr:ATP-grasp domain-containing protein [Lacticaseibacillus sharpeae]